MELSSDSIATFHSRRTRASFAVVGFCDCTTVCYPSTVYFIISIYYLYRLFLGQECKRAWKMFNERQPTTQLTSPKVWHEYAKVLYDIPGQPPLPHPHVSRPHGISYISYNGQSWGNLVFRTHMAHAHMNQPFLLHKM